MTASRRTARILLAAALVAPAAGVAQPNRELQVRIPEAPQGVRLDTIGRREVIAAPPVRTYDAVRAAYEEFGIPRNTESVQFGEIGNTQFVTRRTFANERMSKSIDCGRGMTGDYADQYRVTLAVVTWVSLPSASADTSYIHTALVGGGRATDGATAWPIQCASLGYFERKLARRVRELVKAGATP